MAATGSEEVGATVTGDVVTVTSVASLNRLQNTRDTNTTREGVTDARAAAGITTRWMGRSTAGEMVEPGVNLRVHNAGAEGGGETGTTVTETSEERV